MTTDTKEPTAVESTAAVETAAAAEEAEEEPKSESPSNKRKPEEEPAPVTNTRTKRERKSIERLEDAYIGTMSRSKEVAVGRGLPLGTMGQIAENIKKAKMKGAELATAHNFCFGGRGKDRLKKTQLLEFSGYLPAKEEGLSAAKQMELDTITEDKFAIKANKMTIAGIKKICDFFDIDRSHKTGKEDLVQCLLTFLGSPDEKLTKSYTKTSKKSTTTKKTKKKNDDENNEDDDDDEEEEMEDIDGKSVPTDNALRKWVKAYIACFNLEKVTAKHALETCADKFDVSYEDMAATGKKKTLKTILTEEMLE